MEFPNSIVVIMKDADVNIYIFFLHQKVFRSTEIATLMIRDLLNLVYYENDVDKMFNKNLK